MAKCKVKLSSYFFTGGEMKSPGDVVECDDKQANDLVDGRAGEIVETAKAVKKPAEK